MADRKISEIPIELTAPKDTDRLEASRDDGTETAWTTAYLKLSALRTWFATLFAPLSHVSQTTSANDVHGSKTYADSGDSATLVSANAYTDGEIVTHDGSGAAHGGVEANFAAHDGSGGAAHAVVVAGLSNGFMTGADKTKLDGVAAGANDYTHPNHTGDVTSVGDGAQTIAANAVTNAKAADMAANTVKLRVTTTGDPTDSTIEALADGGTPAATDAILGQKAGGDLVKFLGANLGGDGGGDLSAGTPFVTGDLTAVQSSATVQSVGFAPADVGRLSVANAWAALNTYDGVSASGIYWAASGTPIFAAIHSAGSDLFIQRTTGAGVLDGGGVTLTAGKSVSVGTPAGAGFTDQEGYLNVESAVISSLGSFIENGGTPAEYLHPTKAATVLATVGYAGTANPVAGPIVPNPTDGQYLRIAANATVNLPTETGTVLIDIDAGVTITWNGSYRQIGTEGTGARQAVVSFVFGGVAVVAHL